MGARTARDSAVARVVTVTIRRVGGRQPVLPGPPVASERGAVLGPVDQRQGAWARLLRGLYQQIRLAEQLLVPHIQSGRVLADETIADGFYQIVNALLGMLCSENTGKMLVRLTP